MISALFIVQSFPKWFVYFWMTFCKNSSRIWRKIIFGNKHWLQSCLWPFKSYWKLQQLRYSKAAFQHIFLFWGNLVKIWLCILHKLNILFIYIECISMHVTKWNIYELQLSNFLMWVSWNTWKLCVHLSFIKDKTLAKLGQCVRL